MSECVSNENANQVRFWFCISVSSMLKIYCHLFVFYDCRERKILGAGILCWLILLHKSDLIILTEKRLVKAMRLLIYTVYVHMCYKSCEKQFQLSLLR